MERLIPFLREVLRMKERGGRVRRVSGHEVLVLDVGVLTEAQLHSLHAASLHVSVHASAESLSGFAVRVRLDTTPTNQMLTAAGLLAILGAVIAHCMEFI